MSYLSHKALDDLLLISLTSSPTLTHSPSAHWPPAVYPQPGLLQPQELALLPPPATRMPMAHSLSSFGSSLKRHCVSEAFPDHLIENTNQL